MRTAAGATSMLLVSSMTLMTERAARMPQTIAPHLTTPGGTRARSGKSHWAAFALSEADQAAALATRLRQILEVG
jgi:hypothetical protein